MSTPEPSRDCADCALRSFQAPKLTILSEQISRQLGRLGLADSERRHNICSLGQSTETSRRSPTQCHLQHIQEDEASDSLLAYTYGDRLRSNAVGDGEVRL